MSAFCVLGGDQAVKVIKSLNNNMVLACDAQGHDCICQGKGIGWQKRQGDTIDESCVERRFIPANADESRHFQQLFSEIPDVFWKIAEDVVAYADQRHGIKVPQKIILPLCDHMAGSAERYRSGVHLTNPMLWDVKRVYPKEFKVGKYALEQIRDQIGIDMLEDEAAFLAYHFINAQLGNLSASASPDTLVKLVGDIVELVQQSFQISLNEEDWNYQRFLTHLKFFANRIVSHQACEEDNDEELYEDIRRRYPHVYRCVQRIVEYILREYTYEVPGEEQLYLMIHIERVTRRCRRPK